MAANKNTQASRAKKKWSERDTTKFIELYEAEEVLWNVKLGEYKNKDARNAALQRLIQNFNFDITVEEVNKKINNIRSTYSQEKAKIKKSSSTGSGTDDVYVPSLPWFEIADRFLANVVKCRKTLTNASDSDAASPDAASSQDIPQHPSPDIPSCSSPDIPSQPLHPSPDIQLPPAHDITAHLSPESDIQAASNSNNEIFAKPQQNKRYKRTLLPKHIEKSIDTLQSIKNQVLNSREIEDEFSHFAKNVASQLRQLPLSDALDVQSDILHIIKRKRIHNMENNSSSSSRAAEYTIEIPEHIFNHLDSQVQVQDDCQVQVQNDCQVQVQDDCQVQVQDDCQVQVQHDDSQLQVQYYDSETQEISTSFNVVQNRALLEEAIRSIGGINNNETAEE